VDLLLFGTSENDAVVPFEIVTKRLLAHRRPWIIEKMATFRDRSLVRNTGSV
jgi:hypothetical protein